MEGWRQRLGGEQCRRWQQTFLCLDWLYFVRMSAAAVKALRFAPTADAARRARPGLRPLTSKISNHPVKAKKSLIKGLTGHGLLMEGRCGGWRKTRQRQQTGRSETPPSEERPFSWERRSCLQKQRSGTKILIDYIPGLAGSDNPVRIRSSVHVLFRFFRCLCSFLGEAGLSALTSSFVGVAAFLAAFTVAAWMDVATVWSTSPPLMPLLMAFLTALLIALRAFFSGSFLAIMQYLNVQLVPQLEIVQGRTSLIALHGDTQRWQF